MNLLELYKQFLDKEAFNNTEVKGIIDFNGWSFDIRIVNDKIYCNGISLEDFIWNIDEGKEEVLLAISRSMDNQLKIN